MQTFAFFSALDTSNAVLNPLTIRACVCRMLSTTVELNEARIFPSKRGQGLVGIIDSVLAVQIKKRNVACILAKKKKFFSKKSLHQTHHRYIVTECTIIIINPYTIITHPFVLSHTHTYETEKRNIIQEWK